MASNDLSALLHQTFGFANFRANQEAVCRAATDGKDVLLVMPTGAGKSLCYQIPAIARGGTGLVISPLIALMDDQANKLTAAGLRVARIHSGLSREDARQACRDYLDGHLQFLFIAPERMRVPGFPEMLAKRKPSLIAIDEAHCISAWGHDFRPDYRTLGEHLPALRPAPIIALTATATPQVQKDIATQLNLHQPALFIHGFRRDNLHIEVVEMSKPRRNQFTVELLNRPGARPAIVYAPSRKAADELAGMLGRKASAYHAGLDTSVREHVQAGFQAGRIEVVVATIAFGMGIDKADVRTVVHIALPASVEAYYQEIGRAGRDGAPSRTILLYSFADRKMHDFFLERDYPPISELGKVAAVLNDEFKQPDELRARLRMDADTLAKSIEKLASQGAAQIDMAGNVRRGNNPSNAWKSGYDAQIAFRRSQIDRMQQYADTQQCRMTALIRHFGDVADATRPCGHCDFCSPEGATAQSFSAPSAEQDRQLRTILRALDGAMPKATGRLFTDMALGIDRKEFDGLLDALARSGLVSFTSDQWTNPEGKVIQYKKVSLTYEGQTLDPGADLPVVLREVPEDSSPKSKSKSRSKSSSTGVLRGFNPVQAAASYSASQKDLEARLREWRKAEAGKTGKPAFVVFADKVLDGIVQAQPQTLDQLLRVSGIGPDRADRYGAEIIAMCRGGAAPVARPAAPKAAKPRRAPAPAQSFLAEASDDPQTFGDDADYFAHASTLDEDEESYVPAAPPRPATAVASPPLIERPATTSQKQDFEADLRFFRDQQAAKLNVKPSALLSHSALAELLRFRPRTDRELSRLTSLRTDLPPAFYGALLALCTADYAPEPELVEAQAVIEAKPAVSPDLTSALTPDQQILDERLRAWRKAEAERTGKPQFFLMGATTLRGIVLERPRTLAELEAISGMGSEKVKKFGAAILELCR
ncbi:ATP-dependent DNA helicase RecQ [Granulicella rosea]|uniref:ATP-dependent DNA helicase RecQ n=1 Tax=Granulicella rosea TaxID=474952 RepID=A0A239H5J1_9BACT|nr:RecQ family ATP-dependent DNA helicase [Granulicella rosea]SNS76482.1 ATP-dependent DNA helicase RecQ [Granulicella rosea]